MDLKYIEGFVEGCLDRIGKDEPEDEDLLRDLWEGQGERDTVLMVLQAECEVLPGGPEDLPPFQNPEVLPGRSISSVPHIRVRIYPRYSRHVCQSSAVRPSITAPPGTLGGRLEMTSLS
jgi:hypothetical protein